MLEFGRQKLNGDRQPRGGEDLLVQPFVADLAMEVRTAVGSGLDRVR